MIKVKKNKIKKDKMTRVNLSEIAKPESGNQDNSVKKNCET